MPHVIEEAKSGRATCRTCRALIEKGAPRFGFETQGFNEGQPGHLWHHLLCAAKKYPAEVTALLQGYAGAIPNRAEVDAALAAGPAKKQEVEKAFPYAERASTGRAKCQKCEGAIEKGSVRIAVERDIEVMGNVRKGAGYFHPACAEPQLVEQLKADLDAL